MRSLAALLLASLLLGCGSSTPALTVGATTTLQDSGLLDALLAGFRARHPDLRVRAVTGGTGEILALGRRGDADVLLTHDTPAESAFVAAGHGAATRAFARSDYLLAGPAADPAGAATASDAAAALRRIAAARAAFVSRGDDSGTHRRELELWRAAGLEPDTFPRGGGAWYIDAGSGMAEALALAAERRAYVLSDLPTWLAVRPPGLAVHVREGPGLINLYGATLSAAPRSPAAARAFYEWLAGPDAAAIVAGFGAREWGTAPFEAVRPDTLAREGRDGPAA